MLGFNAISEVSIAELPGAFVPVSSITPVNIGITSALGSVGITAVGAADVSSRVPVEIGLTTSLGTISVTGDANITVAGFSATLSLTSVIVWGKIIPAPGTSYTAITPSSSPTWTEKTTGVSQTWTEVA